MPLSVHERQGGVIREGTPDQLTIHDLAVDFVYCVSASFSQLLLDIQPFPRLDERRCSELQGLRVAKKKYILSTLGRTQPFPRLDERRFFELQGFQGEKKKKLSSGTIITVGNTDA